ncbi:MAG: hypothetical protein WC009_07900 [Methylotenera sp.]
MRRKYKAIDINELIDADDIDRTTMKGEMRKLYPAIHEKLSEKGWSAQNMVEWLGERGIKMSVELFRVYLRNLDHERGYKRSANKSHLKASVVIAVTEKLKGNEQQKVTDLAPKSAGKLERPPGISNSAWSELQVKAAAENRKKL